MVTAVTQPATTGVSNPFAVLDTAGGKAAPGGGTESTASADRFLTMLVTQLKNQDPLNPMDNAQITSQMAQINAVTGLEKVNESVKSLNVQLLQMQALQGAALVGRDVLVPGNTLAVKDGTGRGVVELAGPATDVQVLVIDGSGRQVGARSLGDQPPGRVPFEFDMGRLSTDRGYTFQVVAASGKNAVPAQTLALDRVTSVSTEGDTLTLQLARSGAMPASKVVSFN
jgi:flagellar basal-body rod modification protein FlgD